MKKITLLFTLLLIGVSSLYTKSSYAQTSVSQVPWTDTTFTEYNRWYIGGAFGVYQFYGDLAEHTYFPGTGKKGKFNWMFDIQGGREFNQRFGIRSNFTMGKMFSERADNWFEADVRDLSLDFTVNMTNLVAPYMYNKKWNATLYVGAGFFGYHSISYDLNDNITNYVGYDAQGNKDKMKITSCFNVGMDFAYRISNHLDVYLEIGVQNTPVDNLDSKIVTLSELDNYSHVALGVHYTFGKLEEAYKWNPKPDYMRSIEEKIVDMGNNIEETEKCCQENKIDPCDTSTVDDDNDKVPNCRDLELLSPKGSIVNFQGIAIMYPDSVTGEPIIARNAQPRNQGNDYPQNNLNGGGNNGTPTKPNTNGTGNNRKPMRGAPAIFFSPVFFEFDKTVVDSTGEFNIINVALYMKMYPESRILISGNTDKHGTNPYNDDLSTRRCEKIKNILIKDYGIEGSRLETQPNGEEFLLFPRDHANRRVDFSVIQ